MFVSTKYAKKHKLESKSDFIILGGPLNNGKLTLVDPTESAGLLEGDEVDFENKFGTAVNILNPLSKVFLRFDKNKPGSNGKRITMLVSGPSGCGKSTFCINYMNVFRHLNKDPEKYPIYFITKINDDKRVDKITGCTVINIFDDDDIHFFLVDPQTKLSCKKDYFGISNLNNALVVFDDIEGADKDVESLLNSLLKEIMEVGRHNCCSLIWSRHVLNNNNRIIQTSLAEIMYIILFRGDAYKKLTYFCEKYLAQGKELVKYIRKDSGSRFTLIHNRCPFFIMTDSSIQVIND